MLEKHRPVISSVGGHFMEKTKNMLRKFHSCTLNAVRRDANLAARCLARRHTVNVDG